MSRLNLQVITYDEACLFVSDWHRHHLPPQGWKWGVAVNDGEKIVGVACVGRPVARRICQERVAEVTRLCTIPVEDGGGKNAASKLLAACEKAAFSKGYVCVMSYTLADSESGVSYKAAGWRPLYQNSGGSWDTPKRRRVDKAPTENKTLWVSPNSIDPRGLAEVPRIKYTAPEDKNQLTLFDVVMP